MGAIITTIVCCVLLHLLIMLAMKLHFYGDVEHPKTPGTPTWFNVIAIAGGLISGVIYVIAVVCMLFGAFGIYFWREIIQPVYKYATGGRR